ncbi:MAG: biopolymer transporter ExbD [Trueperaceae bacterium]
MPGRRTRRARLAPILDLTPMVDVVFLLIIFFMVSTTFITLESGLPVDLPQAQSAQAQAEGTPTVTIDAGQRIYLAGTEVDEASLVPMLEALLAERGTDVVVLRADQSVPHGLTVRIMDAIRRAGAQRVAIAAGG